MKAWLIRKATLVDAHGIARAQVQSWNETYRGLLPDDYIDGRTIQRRLEIWKTVLGEGAQTLWVAEYEDQVVGFVNGGPMRSTDDENAGEIYALYVLQRMHGQGIGRALFDHAREALRTDGYRYFVVTVLKENPAAAFYERMGGVAIDELLLVVGDREIPETVYKLSFEADS